MAAYEQGISESRIDKNVQLCGYFQPAPFTVIHSITSGKVRPIQGPALCSGREEVSPQVHVFMESPEGTEPARPSV